MIVEERKYLILLVSVTLQNEKLNVPANLSGDHRAALVCALGLHGRNPFLLNISSKRDHGPLTQAVRSCLCLPAIYNLYTIIYV